MANLRKVYQYEIEFVRKVKMAPIWYYIYDVLDLPPDAYGSKMHIQQLEYKGLVFYHPDWFKKSI